MELSQGPFIHCVESMHKQTFYSSFAKVPVHYKADQKHFSKDRVGLKLGGGGSCQDILEFFRKKTLRFVN